MNKSRSSFALVAFCAAASLLAALGLAVIFTSVTIAVAGDGGTAYGENRPASPEATNPVRIAESQVPLGTQNQRSFAGLITDDRCGARHAPNSAKSSTECVEICIRRGAHYALVNGDKSYLLDGNVEDLGKLAGQRADVVGSLTGDTIKVSSVSVTQ